MWAKPCSVPLEVLAGDPHSVVTAVETVQRVQVATQRIEFFRQWRITWILVSIQKTTDTPQQPGLSLSRPTDHDGIGPCGLQDPPGMLRGIDITVGDHWDRYCRLDLGDGVIVDGAMVFALPAAAMNGQCPDTGLLGNTGDVRIFKVTGTSTD